MKNKKMEDNKIKKIRIKTSKIKNKFYNKKRQIRTR